MKDFKDFIGNENRIKETEAKNKNIIAHSIWFKVKWEKTRVKRNHKIMI